MAAAIFLHGSGGRDFEAKFEAVSVEPKRIYDVITLEVDEVTVHLFLDRGQVEELRSTINAFLIDNPLKTTTV